MHEKQASIQPIQPPSQALLALLKAFETLPDSEAVEREPEDRGVSGASEAVRRAPRRGARHDLLASRLGARANLWRQTVAAACFCQFRQVKRVCCAGVPPAASGDAGGERMKKEFARVCRASFVRAHTVYHCFAALPRWDLWIGGLIIYSARACVRRRRARAVLK